MGVDELQQYEGGHGVASTSTILPSKRSHQANQTIHLQDDDAFDIEAYVAPYAGKRRIERLLFIARSCPELRDRARQLALKTIETSTLDYKLYLHIIADGDGKSVHGDERWVEEARVKQESGMEKLDVELKNYQNNLIKESIRMGYRDIGDFNRKSGDLAAAIRAYGKSRDYCTTPQHVLDMCLSVIDTAMDQCSYATVRSHVMKAEHALSTISGPALKAAVGATRSTRSVNLPGILESNQPGRREEEARAKQFQLLGEKLNVASAVGALGQGEFDKAARGFLSVSAPQTGSAPIISSSRDSASTNTAHFISAADIGLYGILCGMATLNRDTFKQLVLDNADFRPYLEHNQFLKSLIREYHNSKFQAALDTIDKHTTRLLLDIHLSSHVAALVSKIKAKMLGQYFEPFRAVNIDKMASAFGWESKAMEEELIQLIKNNQIPARIDAMRQTVVAHHPDSRDKLYGHALQVAEDSARSSQAVAWRMKLIQADLMVDPKKDSTSRQQQQRQHASREQDLSQQSHQQQQGQQTSQQGQFQGKAAGKAR